MVVEYIAASLIGALIATLRFYKMGAFVMFQMFISSFFLSYYGSIDVVNLVMRLTGFSVSLGAAHFLTAFYGATLLDGLKLYLKGKVLKWSS